MLLRRFLETRRLLSLGSFVNILQGFAGVAFFIVVARTLSVEAMGEFSFAMAVYSFSLSLTFTGFDTTINKAALTSKHEFVKQALLAALFLTSLVAIVLVSLTFIVQDHLGFSPNELSYIRIALFLIPIFALDRSEHIFLGYCEFTKLSAWKTSSTILMIAGAIYFKLHPGSSFECFLFLIGVRVFQTFLGLLIASRIPAMKTKFMWQKSLNFKETWKLSGLGLFTGCLSSLRQMVLYQISPEALALFAVGNKFPEKIKDYAKLIVIIPIQTLFKSGREKTQHFFRVNLNSLSLIALFVSIIMGLLLALTIPWIFGPKYSDAYLVTFLMSLTLAPKIIGCLLQYSEIVFDDSDFFIKNTILQSMLEILISLALIYKFKHLGLCIATVTSVYLNFYLSYRRTHSRSEIKI